MGVVVDGIVVRGIVGGIVVVRAAMGEVVAVGVVIGEVAVEEGEMVLEVGRMETAVSVGRDVGVDEGMTVGVREDCCSSEAAHMPCDEFGSRVIISCSRSRRDGFCCVARSCRTVWISCTGEEMAGGVSLLLLSLLARPIRNPMVPVTKISMRYWIRIGAGNGRKFTTALRRRR